MSHNTFFINPIPDDNGWAVIHHMVAADKPLLNQVRIFVDADKNLLRTLVEIDSESILNLLWLYDNQSHYFSLMSQLMVVYSSVTSSKLSLQTRDQFRYTPVLLACHHGKV